MREYTPDTLMALMDKLHAAVPCTLERDEGHAHAEAWREQVDALVKERDQALYASRQNVKIIQQLRRMRRRDATRLARERRYWAGDSLEDGGEGE